MTIKLISGADDMAWLQSTTKIDCRDYLSAVISGNEDCPERVDLYKSEMPTIREAPTTWWYVGDTSTVNGKPGGLDCAAHYRRNPRPLPWIQWLTDN